MIRITTLATIGLLTSALAAHAAPQLERIRGTVEKATDTSLTVKTADGSTKEVALASGTAFVNVVKSSLDEVKDGKFIGTATKGDNPPVAIEVVIFPPEMKGTAEGHYDWDAITDTTTGGSGVTKSKMTNGTIKAKSLTNSKMTNGTIKAKSLTNSKMTNGTIKSSSASGKKTIDVTYDNGQSLKIEVPDSAPIVAFEKQDKSIVKPGATVFAVAAVDGGKLEGKLVAIGKDGVTPPM